jgi:hypothetical protein
MPYTTDEGGRLNNFAIEPKVYVAEPPSSKQKAGYLVMGIGAVVLIAGLLSVAFLVS